LNIFFFSQTFSSAVLYLRAFRFVCAIDIFIVLAEIFKLEVIALINAAAAAFADIFFVLITAQQTKRHQ
jgi:hypothetical protein